METLEIIESILKPILYLALVCLTVYLIISLKRVTASVEKIEKNVDDVSLRLEPMISEMNTVITEAKIVTTGAKAQIEKINGVTDDIKHRTKEILDFSKYIQDEIETPIKNTFNYIGALTSGVSVFYKKLITR